VLTQEQVNELLESAKPSIIQSIKEDLKQSITYEMKQVCARQVKEHTEQWIKENVIPEITKELIEGKDGLIAVGVKLGPAIVDEVVKSMTAAVAENLKQSYSRRGIFEALLK
jgi:hypothetical protein